MQLEAAAAGLSCGSRSDFWSQELIYWWCCGVPMILSNLLTDALNVQFVVWLFLRPDWSQEPNKKIWFSQAKQQKSSWKEKVSLCDHVGSLNVLLFHMIKGQVFLFSSPHHLWCPVSCLSWVKVGVPQSWPPNILIHPSQWSQESGSWCPFLVWPLLTSQDEWGEFILASAP